MSHTPTTPITHAERVHTGLLVALWLEPNAAAELAIAGGEAAEDLHITLCYCPDAGEWDQLKTFRAVSAVERAVNWRSAPEGRVGGYGRFLASDTSDAQDVFYASVDSPGLGDLRNVVESALCEAAARPSDDHGYTPHITLQYLDPDAPNPVDRLPATKLEFTAITIMFGEGERIDIPFSPTMIFAESVSLKLDRGVGRNGLRFNDFRRPLTFTGASEWVQFLPPPGTYHHIFYGDMELTAEKYERMVANFTSSVYGQTLPINCEHDMPASGAVGYIAGMRIADDGSIEVKPEWNDRGKALIEGDRFRYVSAEFFESWQDPVTGDWHDDVAFGMAICTNPHFKETVLRPLAASEAPGTHVFTATGLKGAQDMGNTNEQKPTDDQQPASITLSEADFTKLRETANRVETAEQTVKALTERAETAEGQVTQLTERVTTMERDARHKRFTDLVAGRGGSTDGAAWFGDPAGHVATLEMLADIGGEQGDEVKRYTEQQNAIASQLKDSKLFSEIGSSNPGESDVDTQIKAQVAKLREQEPSLTAAQAEARVYSEHPDLYEAAMKGGS
jgi:2'-5' RNA ligase